MTQHEIYALGWKLTSEDEQLITNMSKYLKREIHIVDVSAFSINTVDTDIVLIFGVRANRAFKNPHRIKIRLPDVGLLHHKGSKDGSKERKETFEILKQLKKDLDEGTVEALYSPPGNNKASDGTTPTEKSSVVNTEKFPSELTADKVKELERQILKQNVSHWSALTADNKKIKVTLEPEIGTADINLTFSELFAVMALKESFQVKDLEIVYKPSVTSGKNTSK